MIVAAALILVAWLAVMVLVVALCRMAARGDEARVITADERETWVWADGTIYDPHTKHCVGTSWFTHRSSLRRSSN